MFLIPLAAIAAAVLGILFWQSSVRTAQVEAPAATKVEETAVQTAAPVVAPPDTPIKADPEPATTVSTAPAQAPVAAPTKKQIYDRIVGDNEVPGSASLNPSEVQPIEPAAAPNADDPAAPALQDQGTGDAAPLPVPPPAETGTQGAIKSPPALPLDEAARVNTAVASAPQPASVATAIDDTALAAASADAASQEIRPASADPETATAIEDILPLPKDKVVTSLGVSAPETAGQSEPTQTTMNVADPPPPDPVPKTQSGSAAAAFVDASTQADATTGETSVTVPEGTTATDEAPAAAAPVAKAETVIAESKPAVVKPKKVVAKQIPAKKVAAKPKKSVEPVVLVAPGGQEKAAAVAAGDDGIYGALSETSSGPSAESQAPKRRTLLELFNQQKRNKPNASGEQQVAVVQPQQQAAPKRVATQQVAVAEPEATSTGGRGFVAQLASFRTQEDAEREYQRLKSQHGAIVSGLTPVINETVVGGSKRYRLAVGTMQSNAAAGQVCSRLLAAGERDCLVRQR